MILKDLYFALKNKLHLMKTIKKTQAPSTLSMLAGVDKPKGEPKPFISFTQKLYEMVSDPCVDAIHWNRTGDGFRVTDTGKLCDTIFPHYFKHNSWPSFTRQLNMYGFTRVAHSNDISLEFKHRHFIQGQSHLLRFIQRRVVSTVSLDTPRYEGIRAELESHIESLRFANHQLWRESREMAALINQHETTMSQVAAVLAQSLSQHDAPQPEIASALHRIHTSLKNNKNMISSPPTEYLSNNIRSQVQLPSLRNFLLSPNNSTAKTSSSRLPPLQFP